MKSSYDMVVQKQKGNEKKRFLVSASNGKGLKKKYTRITIWL